MPLFTRILDLPDVWASRNLVLLARRQGDLDQALASAVAGLGAAWRQSDMGIVTAALDSLALVHADNVAPAAANPLVEEALAQAMRMGNRHREAALRNILADLRHSCGRDDQAMTQIKQADDLSFLSVRAGIRGLQRRARWYCQCNLVWTDVCVHTGADVL